MQSRSTVIKDWVFQVLRTGIRRGVLPLDMPLRQDELSAALKVSHIPVREAFRQLEAQGLVRIYPNRGAVVTRLSYHEMQNITDMRMLLEVGALKAAIPNLTEDDIVNAYAHLTLYGQTHDSYKMDEQNLAFHLALYKPCGNELLLSHIDQLHANVDRYLHAYFASSPEYQQASSQRHRDILEAAQAGDISAATEALTLHLQNTKALLLSSPLLS